MRNNSTAVFAVLISIGIIGNAINIKVFSHKSMRKNSTFKFLFYLSIIDLFVLLICATDSLMTYGYLVIIRLYSESTCKMHTFLTYFLTHMSSVVLMIVSIDRAIVVSNHSQSKFERRKSSSSRKLSVYCQI